MPLDPGQAGGVREMRGRSAGLVGPGIPSTAVHVLCRLGTQVHSRHAASLVNPEGWEARMGGSARIQQTCRAPNNLMVWAPNHLARANKYRAGEDDPAVNLKRLLRTQSVARPGGARVICGPTRRVDDGVVDQSGRLVRPVVP
jgi:hypothetical protein